MLTFDRGRDYTRPDVKERAGLLRTAKGGNWDTGVVEHESEFLIFTNIGTEGRTGHNYGNRWEENRLRWYHKGGSHLRWQSVQKLLESNSRVHVFWRSSNDSPFTYAGLGRVEEFADTSPVEILWSFEDISPSNLAPPVQSPEDITRGEYREGSVRQILVNAYERDRAARQASIDHHGLKCSVCDLLFENLYGEIGAGFIHVHHVVQLADLGQDYAIDPVNDLQPVCPNCHAMLHRQRPPLKIQELRKIVLSRR